VRPYAVSHLNAKLQNCVNSEIILRDFWADILRVAHPNPITEVWRTLLTKSVVELAQSDEAQFIGQERAQNKFQSHTNISPLSCF
jgi:hypothetical protein